MNNLLIRKRKIGVFLKRAQHAHATDRFAREILGILECDPSRSRRLMRNSFGCCNQSLFY